MCRSEETKLKIIIHYRFRLLWPNTRAAFFSSLSSVSVTLVSPGMQFFFSPSAQFSGRWNIWPLFRWSFDPSRTAPIITSNLFIRSAPHCEALFSRVRTTFSYSSSTHVKSCMHHTLRWIQKWTARAERKKKWRAISNFPCSRRFCFFSRRVLCVGRLALLSAELLSARCNSCTHTLLCFFRPSIRYCLFSVMDFDIPVAFRPPSTTKQRKKEQKHNKKSIRCVFVPYTWIQTHFSVRVVCDLLLLQIVQYVCMKPVRSSSFFKLNESFSLVANILFFFFVCRSRIYTSALGTAAFFTILAWQLYQTKFQCFSCILC